MKADLHNHSNYSDGVLPVNQLVDRAINNGVNIMGLTDHDSVFGVDEAYDLGKQKGLFVLKGLELSTFFNGDPIHIVCYFKYNQVPQGIYDFSQKIIDERINRAKKMMKNIEDIYHVNVDYDFLFSSKIVTRGNMFRTILHSNPGIDVEKANEMVSSKSKAYIPASKRTTKEGVEMLRKYDCVLILAHPCLYNREYLDEILSYGFDGIEAIYPKNKEDDFEYMKKLALKYHLFISAGSDFHGDINHADIGTSTLNDDQIQIILNKLEIKKGE